MRYIYLTTNLVNGKQYVGQRKLPDNLTIEKDKYIGSGTLLLAAVKKYGKENFIKEILHICESQEDADKFEIDFIEKNNCIDDEQYYNIDCGGQYGRANKHSEITSKAMKNFYNNPNNWEIYAKLAIKNSWSFIPKNKEEYAQYLIDKENKPKPNMNRHLENQRTYRDVKTLYNMCKSFEKTFYDNQFKCLDCGKHFLNSMKPNNNTDYRSRCPNCVKIARAKKYNKLSIEQGRTKRGTEEERKTHKRFKHNTPLNIYLDVNNIYQKDLPKTIRENIRMFNTLKITKEYNYDKIKNKIIKYFDDTYGLNTSTYIPDKNLFNFINNTKTVQNRGTV